MPSDLTPADRERIRDGLDRRPLSLPMLSVEEIRSLLDAADERDRLARDIAQEEANELQGILRTLKASARELVGRWETLTAERVENARNISAQAATILLLVARCRDLEALCTCYRVGKKPSESLLDRLANFRDAAVAEARGAKP